MKFVIEIYGAASDGSEILLHREMITAVNPIAARREANYLLSVRKKATGARVLNSQGEVIYRLDK